MKGFWLFFPICAVIAVVFSAAKEDRPRAVAIGSIRWFLLLCTAVMVGSGVVYAIGQYL
ncbi:MAG: hypothetical protein HYY93_15920 [Planctomycetes bacterium]|nr:hypothetical protein [Planctomycetota bacterium]